MSSAQVVPCSGDPNVSPDADKILAFMRKAAAAEFAPGLTVEEFCRTPAYLLAVERGRGQNAAATLPKKNFIASILDRMLALGLIASWIDTTGRGRCDYLIVMKSGRRVAIEAKGNLDGNSAAIFERPEGVDEFYIWSMSSNAGTDLRHGIWSGLHSRLGVNIVTADEQIDGLIVLDSICGTAQRPCPKLGQQGEAITIVGRFQVPPPCIFMFPKVVTRDGLSRSQPLNDTEFASALHECFQGRDSDVSFVDYEVLSEQGGLSRQTTLRRGNHLIKQSGFTKINRRLTEKTGVR
ncbi:hypothetical protein [Rhizobium sp. MHM7A]|uniref:hypothetical protein n=1 Tax=Rhizobium sp. MHM7A TaxID=2583233 RepID=UPI001107495E|nr:hypothetical protein [Rhizobium sp. MHM7A]TLX16673.1 hypothetical protein FFR93_04845 [Rhizobium sp. MHM7A]